MFDQISLALHPPRFMKRGIRLYPRRDERSKLARPRVDPVALDDEPGSFSRPEEAA